MKTSSRISLQFTALTTVLVLLFAVLVNGFFFRSWYQLEISGLDRQVQQLSQPKNNRLTPGPLKISRTQVLTLEEYEKNDISHSQRIPHLVEFEESRLMTKRLPRGEKIIVTDVTQLVERQQSLLRLSLMMLILATVLSYLIGRWFVRRSLCDVYAIADFVQTLTIDKLHDNLSFSHLPEDDEINMIALSLNDMTSKLHHQVDVIKRFVSNVSHEFKTPLMVMRSQAEVSLKSKKYKTGLETTLTHVDQMNRLIDTLLQLENKHAAGLLLDDCSITPLLTSLTDQTATKYKDKNINLTLTTSPNLVKKTHRGSLEIILRNLIDNAYKYTPEDGTIIITADTHKLIVSDSGLGIPADQLARIREPFWQADSSKGQDHGLGLGLTLVHSLVQQLGWAIDVVSSDKGTTFTLHFAD